jgi:hypothetical protein
MKGFRIAMWPFSRSHRQQRSIPGNVESLPLPRPAIAWQEPWRQVEDPNEQLGLQRELDAELSSAHPLWGTRPVVFGRHRVTDDILVTLEDGRFAIVHLVWHGHVDQFSADFPSTTICQDLPALEAELREETGISHDHDP